MDLHVERDQSFGPRQDGAAYLIVARIRSTDGRVHSEARGTLAMIEPVDEVVGGWYAARDAFQPGLLQWSPNYGNPSQFGLHPLARICSSWCSRIQIRRLESPTPDNTQRTQSPSLHLASPWRITIEVTAADGAHAQRTFELSPGERDPSHPLKIRFSTQGTLFPPVITVIPQDATNDETAVSRYG